MNVKFHNKEIIVSLQTQDEVEITYEAISEKTIAMLRQGSDISDWSGVESLADSVLKGSSNVNIRFQSASMMTFFRETLYDFTNKTTDTIQEMARASHGASEIENILRRRALGTMAGEMAVQLHFETEFGDIVERLDETKAIFEVEPQTTTPPASI